MFPRAAQWLSVGLFLSGLSEGFCLKMRANFGTAVCDRF